MKTAMQTVVDNLKIHMKINSLSSKEVAQEIGVSEPAIANWFAGRKRCSARHLERISIYTGIPLPALFLPDAAYNWSKEIRRLLNRAS